MHNPLISIVIPIFNRENTLRYCVESVIEQEYKRWELILVDDGSVDGTSDICREYVARDNRIKYVYQSNKGAGPARNNGIELANGEWITFLDSDDAIMPNHLMQLVRCGEGKDMVMVNHCQAKYTNNKLEKVTDYWDMNNVDVTGNKDILEFIFTELNPYQYYVYCCWDKFFRMDVIKQNRIRFPIDIPTGQDMYFVIDYFKYTKDFYFSKEGTYTQTPMGNESIDHLAWKLRPPKEYYHCHIRNYNNLIDLYNKSQVLQVRKYAAHYVLTDTLERTVIRYANWRNRRIKSKRVILDYVDKDFKKIIEENKEYIDCVNNRLYRKHLKKILCGKASEVYDYWFFRNNIINFYYAVKRRLL